MTDTIAHTPVLRYFMSPHEAMHVNELEEIIGVGPVEYLARGMIALETVSSREDSAEGVPM